MRPLSHWVSQHLGPGRMRRKFSAFIYKLQAGYKNHPTFPLASQKKSHSQPAAQLPGTPEILVPKEKSKGTRGRLRVARPCRLAVHIRTHKQQTMYSQHLTPSQRQASLRYSHGMMALSCAHKFIFTGIRHSQGENTSQPVLQVHLHISEPWCPLLEDGAVNPPPERDEE